MFCYLSKNYRGIDGAGNKAKTDIERVLSEAGFRNIGLRQSRDRNVLRGYFYTLASVLKGVCMLRRGDVLLLQYPFKKYYAFVCRMARLRGCRVVTLIHDLGSFRRKKLTPEQEVARLSLSDVVIAHTEAMKAWLLAQGLKREMVVLGIFDYLSESKPEVVNTGTEGAARRLMFVGRLDSRNDGFVYGLINRPHVYELQLYGNAYEPEQAHGQVDYRGFIQSDQLIRTADADFGIVWYGNSLDGCQGGEIGDYLRYNSPHKLSLYIRCGLPVVIWAEAGLADFVRTHRIGLCLSSLEKLDEALAALSREEYDEMKRNVEAMARRVASGHFCRTAVGKACEVLGYETPFDQPSGK